MPDPNNQYHEQLDKRVGRIEFRMDEIVIPKLDKVVNFVDDNKGGITTSTLLNNKVITVVLGAMVAAAVYFAGKGGW